MLPETAAAAAAHKGIHLSIYNNGPRQSPPPRQPGHTRLHRRAKATGRGPALLRDTSHYVPYTRICARETGPARARRTKSKRGRTWPSRTFDTPRCAPTFGSSRACFSFYHKESPQSARVRSVSTFMCFLTTLCILKVTAGVYLIILKIAEG